MAERTRREEYKPAGTRRDGSDDVHHHDRGRVQLPPELVQRGFEKLRELGAGAEADVIVVADGSGAEQVVKLYRPTLSFDESASELLAGADPAHVVDLHETGTSKQWGQRYEVLEYCPLGSMRDVLEGGTKINLIELVRELSTALEHIHSLRLVGDESARLVHQDLKPENVLVRSIEPLDLVLGDFGLARMIAGSVHLTSRQQGSRAYAPPPGEAVSAGWDWWSLGMILTEFASGMHPFRVDGDWLSAAAIDHLLSQGPPDLSSVADDRVRTLCQGLLTRRLDDRWRGEEVRRWLAGERVPVAADRGTQQPGRAVLFDGNEYTTPEELALALQDKWDRSVEQLILRADQTLVVQVEMLLSDVGSHAALQLLQPDNLANPHTRLANLLAEMNPDLPPRFRGVDVRPLALRDQLDDRTTAANTVALIDHHNRGLLETRVLSSWRKLREMDTAVDAETRLVAAKAYLDNHREALKEFGVLEDELEVITRQAYSVALDASQVSELRRRLGQEDTAAASSQTWWADIARESANDELGAPTVVALLTRSLAARQTHEAEIAERAAEDRRAAERRAEERRSAEERAERAREQRRATIRRSGRAITNAVGLGLKYLLFLVPASLVTTIWANRSFASSHDDSQYGQALRHLLEISVTVAIIASAVGLVFNASQVIRRRATFATDPAPGWQVWLMVLAGLAGVALLFVSHSNDVPFYEWRSDWVDADGDSFGPTPESWWPTPVMILAAQSISLFIRALLPDPRN